MSVWLVCAFVLASVAVAAPKFPALTGPVVDEAGVLDAQAISILTQELSDFQKNTGRQFVIVTIKDLQGYEVADYGYQLGRHWQIGDAKRDDGILLIIAPNDRKVRIEVGYGLEGVMPDAMAHFIINKKILPFFRKDMMADGIIVGARAIINQLSMDEGAAKAQAQNVVAQSQESDRIDPVQAIFMLLFFVIFVFISGRRSRRASLWGGGFGTYGGWGGGGFGGGGFGGGGGGGGSFGGGGASGGW